MGRRKVKPLDFELRRKIRKHIKKNPGVTFCEIEEEFDMSLGSTTHHLKVLLDHKLIKFRKAGYFKRFFDKTCDLRKIPPEVNRNEATVLSALEKDAFITQKELIEKTGLSQSTVSRKLHVLSEKNLLELNLMWNGVSYRKKRR